MPTDRKPGRRAAAAANQPRAARSATAAARSADAGDPFPLTGAQRLELLYLMRLTRAFDARISTLYRQNMIHGAAFSSLGQEAVSVGTTYALEPDDVIGPMIRNSGSILTKGMEPERFMANYMAKATSPTRGRDGNTHLGDLGHGIIAPISMLGILIPVCAGAGLAFKIRGERRVAMTWIGDGGSSIGDFHEGLNFAAVLKLPLILVLENNQYAYSTPVDRQCLVENFADKAEGYGIPGPIVDGNDVIAVYRTTREAVERARRGDGPTLIEAKTMRMKGHAEHDDFRYVPDELIEEWKKKDPIERFTRQLRDEALLPDDENAAIDARVAEAIETAVRIASEAPLPDPDQAREGVYADNR
jgi:TPP-dependent pyruvate/acetoin dehydrogenase alpha subunit